MASRKINTDLEFQGNQVNNMRLEHTSYNGNYSSDHPAGQIIYRHDLGRFIGTTEQANNSYQNKIAFLSDIQNSGGGGSSAPIPQKTLFVSPNFNNTNKHYSNVINAYNNASSGDTIVIYSGTYPFPNWVDKNITFNCVGDVILTADYVVNIRDSKCTIIGNVDIKFGNENGSNSSTGQHLILHRSFFVVKCNLFVAYCIFQQHNSIVIIDADIFYSNIEFTQSNYPMYLELTARRIGNGMPVYLYAPHIANPFFIFRNCNSNSHARIAAINDKSRVEWSGNNINNLDIKRVKYSYDTDYLSGGLPAYV